MKRLLTYLLLVICWPIAPTFGQLSPGELSQTHAELEGIGNCTQCHDLGAQVSDQKCLACHDEIQFLLNGNRGFHSANSVRIQNCFDCHSEHHGRRFDMMRFDEEEFEHDLTGYELEGQHAVIDCRDCHSPEYIADRDLRSRTQTFLGLGQECLSCHDDYHQRTLSDDCIICHNIESFRPAPGFDHEEADFALRGKHIEVDCKDCHAITTRNGREFQEFTDLPFANCTDCHDDPHNSQLPGSCTQCHTEDSFTEFLGQGHFDHNQTGFVLKGSHRQEDCFSCHATISNPVRVFQDQDQVAENNCVACHEDVHEGKFGDDCAKCHNEESFLALNDMSFFDHSVTDYPLEGLHGEVDCRACHVERFSVPIDFTECRSCHEDYHEGEFLENGMGPDCIECHTLDQQFDYTLYGLEEHQESVFPLEGAHMATPCFACHISEEDEKWHFREVGEACVDCHLDIHEGYIAQSFYPDRDCQACHMSDTWASIEFDHSLTDWPLDGKHAVTDCRACHFEEGIAKNEYTQVFSDLSGECISCHENVHDDEFAIEGVTDCTRCHVTSSWVPEKFDHSTTAFPLEGRHAEIDCRACHEVVEADGTATVVYKLEKFECIDCHQ